MKKDITNRKDLELLVAVFYDKVKTDKTIGHFFSDVMKVKWENHLPIMVDFWENLLFFNNDYEGNPMSIHKTIDKKYPMKLKDFNRWTKLFNSTVDELFTGINAETIKQRAGRIATIMQQSLSKK
jgi:hemoglobin